VRPNAHCTSVTMRRFLSSSLTSSVQDCFTARHSFHSNHEILVQSLAEACCMTCRIASQRSLPMRRTKTSLEKQRRTRLRGCGKSTSGLTTAPSQTSSVDSSRALSTARSAKATSPCMSPSGPQSAHCEGRQRGHWGLAQWEEGPHLHPGLLASLHFR